MSDWTAKTGKNDNEIKVLEKAVYSTPIYKKDKWRINRSDLEYFVNSYYEIEFSEVHLTQYHQCT